MKSLRSISGFTLIELLTATALFGVVTIFLMQTFSVQLRTHMVIDQVSEAQQNVRAVADRMEFDIRGAGYMVPPATAVCAWDNTNAPDVLFVSNPDVIRNANQLAAIDPAMISDRLGAGVNLAAGAISTSNVSLVQNFVDVAADGNDFAVNSGVILVDRSDDSGAVACGVISNVGASSLVADFNGTSITATSSPDVVAIPAHVYRVDGSSRILRDGVVLALDIEDLQVAMFFDANGNRAVDPGEFVGDGVAPNYDPSAVNGADLREVRFNLVIATRDPDPNEDWNLGTGQITENRNPATLPAQDALHRRAHVGRVRVRNTGNM